MQELKNFLIKAKKQTYANKNAKKTSSLRPSSSDYEYEEIINNNHYLYHDTYFGTTNFIGEEVVYKNNKPIWAMNYRGYTFDNTLGEEAMDNALRPALMQIGNDKKILPLRGPSKFVNGDYTYTFEVDGDIKNFSALEKIFKKDKLIYSLSCQGGEIL